MNRSTFREVYMRFAWDSGCAVVLVLVLAGVVSGCGGNKEKGSAEHVASAVINGYHLHEGRYTYTAVSAPVNSCWAPPKELLPRTVFADIAVDEPTDEVLVTLSMYQFILSFNLDRTADGLAAMSDLDVDLAAFGIDCVLHGHGTLQGTMTDDDAFDASVGLDVSETSGAGCAQTIGATLPYLDQLPCSITFEGSGAEF